MREFLYQAGLLLFDDKKNDLRALPKTVRLQILVVLSLMWSVIFTVVFLGLWLFELSVRTLVNDTSNLRERWCNNDVLRIFMSLNPI